ncbi:MAG: ATP-binding protein [Candidatus Rokuibacteriota bacterium]
MRRRTPAEVRTLLDRLDGQPAEALEDEELEFKPWEQDPRSLHRVLREYVVCLANARGGTIVLGVRDRVRTRRDAIQGVGPYDSTGLRRAIYDGTDPHVLVELEELLVDDRILLLVHVPRGMPPHTTSDGLAKIRVGRDCKPLTGPMLARLLASGGQRDPTAEVIPDVGSDDLDPREFEHLRETVRREAQSADLARLPNPAFLEALGLVSEEGVTLAGLLLVGCAESLARHVPQHEVTFLRYPTATRYDQRKDLRGPLLATLRDLEQLVSIHNRVRTVQEEGFGQLEFPDLSWEVAREAVLNAVTHRDYFLRQSVQIALFRDRLEVTSPGGFVDGITPRNVLRHPPVHRNELLARVFQAIGLVNRVGLGVDRIYEGLLRLGKEVPRYTADETHVKLTVSFETHDAFALFVAREERERRRLELDDLLVLRALVSTAAIDRWTAASVLQFSEEEAAKRLVSLREAGYLMVRGRGRTASYNLRRDLAERFRGRRTMDAGLPLDEEHVSLRVLTVLRERGRLSNAEIRRLSGFNRLQVYRLAKRLEAEGRIQPVGRGRGAHWILTEAGSAGGSHTPPARRPRQGNAAPGNARNGS